LKQIWQFFCVPVDRLDLLLYTIIMLSIFRLPVIDNRPSPPTENEALARRIKELEVMMMEAKIPDEPRLRRMRLPEIELQNGRFKNPLLQEF
jgi:hypothetical protein